MEYKVYILENPDGKQYIGQTRDLKCRLESHNSGRANYTSRFSGPWKLIYSEVFSTRGDAVRRERQLKRQNGGDVLRKVIRDL